MFAKQPFQKVTKEQSSQGIQLSKYLDPQVVLHYGIPSSASVLAFDPIQRLLAIGTLDGRIKVIGGHNIEGLLTSPKQLLFKNLEFLQNQGFLVAISIENEIQIWNLDEMCISSTLPWESNITAFSVINGTNYIYIGDEFGLLSVLKYDDDVGELLCLPYNVTANYVSEATGISWPNHNSVVGVLPHGCSHGNRVLIAYENGLIILWDVSEDQVVHLKGQTDLHLKDEAVVSANDVIKDLDNPSAQGDKEISSLCWLTSNESVLAVGYTDGDILIWDISPSASSRDHKAEGSHFVARLQISSADRRLPVIVLKCYDDLSHNDHRGRLFVYGGDEIGSDEVLTILTLDWSSGIESLKCIDHACLALNGSFADMVVMPNAEARHGISLLVLTNPGHLLFYNDAFMSIPMQYPIAVPIREPFMTVGKLSWIDANHKFQSNLLENLAPNQTGEVSMKWPLTGGVPNVTSFPDDCKRLLYIAGYGDGSVRIWDATYSTMSPIFVIHSEISVKGVKIAGLDEPVSALEFYPMTLTMAIGNEFGLVRLFKLFGSCDQSNFHYVTENEHEVHQLHKENGAQYTAVFSISSSPICILRFIDSGNRLVVGFKCGEVAVLNINSLSVAFVTECISVTESPVVSVFAKTLPDSSSFINNSKSLDSKSIIDLEKWVLFILTRDAHIGFVNGNTGSFICSSAQLNKDSPALSMYVLDGDVSVSEVLVRNRSPNVDLNEFQSESGSVNAIEKNYLKGLNVLLCCEDSLSLFSLKSLDQGEYKLIQRVDLMNPCLWSIVIQKDERERGLIVLHCIGVIEIRSLSDLEVVTEISLMSILRWNSKSNMVKTISSTDCGQIMLVNGFEFAILSLFASENDSRNKEEFLPCLHDKVLAAATDSTLGFSHDHKKKGKGILGGILKGFKGSKDVDLEADNNNGSHLEAVFSRSSRFLRDQTVVELTIDDIVIDGPIISSSHQRTKNFKQEQENERAKLFDGASFDAAPKLRTPAEIIAKYRKPGDASDAALHAKDRLVERQEKLERLSRRTEELQSGAENFSSMANELARAMEKRKWWNL